MKDKLIEEIKEHFSGLIDDETAKLLAEYALGEFNKTHEDFVTVEGFVDKIYPIRRFRDNVVVPIIIRNDRVVRVNLWNDTTTLIFEGKLFEGLRVRVKGFLKNGEINVTDVSNIEVWANFDKISSIIPGSKVNIKGKISGIGELKEFKDFKLAEIYVSDESGRVKVVLWNEKINVYKKADIGSEVEIYNGYAKIGKNGELEVHIGKNSNVRFSE